jgi:hypothetical protein
MESSVSQSNRKMQDMTLDDSKRVATAKTQQPKKRTTVSSRRARGTKDRKVFKGIHRTIRRKPFLRTRIEVHQQSDSVRPDRSLVRRALAVASTALTSNTRRVDKQIDR